MTSIYVTDEYKQWYSSHFKKGLFYKRALLFSKIESLHVNIETSRYAMSLFSDNGVKYLFNPGSIP